jgi:hypothetical protein
MPENEGCQSTRFPNVIAKNTVYVGQTKDAPRNKCASKACAERGSPNHPASGTVEALSLIAKYFVAGEPSTIAYLSGTFDGDATAPIVIPPWVSMIALIADAAILSSPYGYVLGDTAIADSAVQVRDFRFLPQRIERLRMEPLLPPPYYVTSYLTAAYSVLKGVELILENVTVTVTGDALSLSTSNLATLKATITSSTFVSSKPGATAVSLLSKDNSALSATLTGNTTTVFQGIALNFGAQDASSLDLSDFQSKREDVGTELSSVPFTICKGTGTSTLSFTGSENVCSGNTNDGVPLFLTSLTGRCSVVKRCSGNNVTQRGQGVVSSQDVIELAKVDYSSTNVRMTSNGPRFLQKISSDALQQSSTSNNFFEYTGGEPLSEPTCSIVLSGLAKLVKKSTGNNYLAKTAEGVPSYFIDVADGATFSGNSTNLTCENKGLGNGKKYVTQGEGATLQESISNCQSVGTGTLLELQQASSGGLTLSSSHSTWRQTDVSKVPLQKVSANGGTMSTSYDHDYVEANNSAGIAAIFTQIGGNTVTDHQGTNNTTVQLGDGDVFDEKYLEDSKNTITVSGCKGLASTGTVRKLLVKTSKNFVQSSTNMHMEQTEDTPMPLKSSDYSGTGTANTTSNGSTYVGRTLGGPMSQNRQNAGIKTVNTSNLNVSNPNGDISSVVMSGDATKTNSSLGTIINAPIGTWKTISLSGKASFQSRHASAQINTKQLLSTTTTEDATASHTFQGSVLNAFSDDLPAFDLAGKNIDLRADSCELLKIGKESLIKSVGADILLSGNTLGRANDDMTETSLIDANGGSFLTSNSTLSVGNGTLLKAIGNTATKIETSTVTGGADAKPTFQIAGLVGKGLQLTSSVIFSNGLMVDASFDGSPLTMTSLQTLVGAGKLVYDGGNAGVVDTGGNCAHAGSARVSPFTNVTTIPASLTKF